MSTLPINEHFNESINTQRIITVGNNPPTVQIVPFLRRRYWHIKPASVTVPILNGFRAATGWNRRVFKAVSSSTTASFIAYEGTPSVTTDTYLDGSLWTSLIEMPDYPGRYSLSGSSWSELEIRALNNLKGQNVSLGVAFAERKQTVRLFTSNLATIRGSLARFQRANPKDWRTVKRMLYSGNLPRASWKNIPKRWLELQYGWSPLLADILGSCKALEKANKEIGRLYAVQAGGKKIVHVDANSATSMGTLYRTYKYDIRYQVKLWYKMRNPLLAELNSLGLVNPASIVWEKVRYSFVVDWFVPIGGWLSAMDADLGYDFVQGIRSDMQRISMEVRRFVPGKPYGPTTRFVGDSPRISWEAVDFIRTKYGGSPVPGLYFKSPFSAGHIANALSLLSQQFRR
jgi:hypothetical protein